MTITQFFKDDTGQYSATRLAFLLWAVGVFGIWAYMCVLTRSLIEIPQTVVEVTGLFMGGKVLQSHIENQQTTKQPTSDPGK